MKRRIIITETDNGVEVEQFLVERNGDVHKADDTENPMDIHRLFHQAMRETKMKHMKAKRERQKEKK